MKIADHRHQITLYNVDTCDLIDEIRSDKALLNNSFFYLDPPYYTKGKDLYVNFYNHNDHVMLFNKLESISDYKWLLSYDNNPEITKLYRGHKKVTYNLTYSVEKKYQGSEVIVYSDNIVLPMKKQKLKNISRIKRNRKSA